MSKQQIRNDNEDLRGEFIALVWHLYNLYKLLGHLSVIYCTVLFALVIIISSKVTDT